MVGGLLRVKGGCVHFDIVPPPTPERPPDYENNNSHCNKELPSRNNWLFCFLTPNENRSATPVYGCGDYHTMLM